MSRLWSFVRGKASAVKTWVAKVRNHPVTKSAITETAKVLDKATLGIPSKWIARVRNNTGKAVLYTLLMVGTAAWGVNPVVNINRWKNAPQLEQWYKQWWYQQRIIDYIKDRQDSFSWYITDDVSDIHGDDILRLSKALDIRLSQHNLKIQDGEEGNKEIEWLLDVLVSDWFNNGFVEFWGMFYDNKIVVNDIDTSTPIGNTLDAASSFKTPTE